MTSTRKRSFAVALAAVCAGGLAAVPAANAAPAVSGQLLVGFEKAVSKDDQERILASADGRLAQRFPAVRGGRLVLVRPRSGKATDALRKRLARDPDVAYAEPDFLQFASAAKTPNHPCYTFDYYTDSNILSVAASTSSDTFASFSNFESESVDVAAPGDDIFSTYLGGGYKVLSGTSMSAPYAAGVAAMLRKQESDASYSDLRYAVRQKVDKPPALPGKVAFDGRLNAQKALAAIGSLVD